MTACMSKRLDVVIGLLKRPFWGARAGGSSARRPRWSRSFRILALGGPPARSWRRSPLWRCRVFERLRDRVRRITCAASGPVCLAVNCPQPPSRVSVAAQGGSQSPTSSFRTRRGALSKGVAGPNPLITRHTLECLTSPVPSLNLQAGKGARSRTLTAAYRGSIVETLIRRGRQTIGIVGNARLIETKIAGLCRGGVAAGK